MTSLLKAAGLTAILAGATAQPNSTVREGEGVTTELSDDASAITYWVSEADGWHVVTTIDILTQQSCDSDDHAVVRLSSVLQPGQSETISIPLPIGRRQLVLRIRRLRDQLEIQRVPISV